MRETKEQIIQLIDHYLYKFPDQQNPVSPLLHFLETTAGTDLIDRKNFIGHITTSAFIIDESAKTLLLLKHKSLQRWLQPGGHVDVGDTSLSGSALREACEETGFDPTHLTLVSPHIFDIDSHSIPENVRKQEPQHIHHDIRFLFKTSHTHRLNISLEESTDSNWLKMSELEGNIDFSWVGKKIKNFI